MADGADRGSRTDRSVSLALFAAGFATFSLLYAVQPLLPAFAREFRVSPAESSLALSLTTGFLAFAILLATRLGIPVSTTHTITGAIVGVGATHRLSAVRWGLAGRIVWAWVLTIPAAGTMAAIAYFILSRIVHL